MNKRLNALFLVIALMIAVLGGSAAGYTAGSYDVTVQGFGGEMKVTATFTNDKLESIVVGDNNETPNIGSNAIEQLPDKIVEAQSLAIDSITGATVTSDAIKKAVEEAITAAGGDVEAWKTAVADAGPKDAVEETADVIVIGGGGAGLSAAVSAAQNGASVILIEKTGALGGNTVRAGGPYNAADPARQAALPPASEAAMASVYALTEVEAKSPEHQAVMDQLKADLAAYEAGDKASLFDSVALHTLQTYSGGDYMAKFDLIQKLTGEALVTTEWMAENGVVWKDDISTVPGGLWPRTHVPAGAAGGDYIKAGKEKAEALGVKIILDCKGNELIVENGRVVGVKAEMTDGTPVTLNAKKAVVIATGGFAANKEMRQQYDPSLNEKLGTTNTPAATGDGIFLGQAAGANLIGMEYIQCLPLGDPETGALNAWMGGIGVEYYYQVNKEGLRFMAEDGRRDTMTQALLKQTDSMSYVITDTNIEGTDGINLWGDNVDDLVAKGRIFRADTIEELAEQIGLDPAVLKATHDQFNAYVAAGKDEDFGRGLFGDPIDTAPFYASPRMPTVHHTMGGLEIDLECHVLDKDGNIIPGLYAAGEVTGGIHGSNRLGGNALLDIHVFGREAGKNAAAEVAAE
ncbi:MAG: flavocytochrome c [Bacillota bacterium]|nr:flavocytochrome c [Bacillota bacterium]